jgi:hypothetical protein
VSVYRAPSSWKDRFQLVLSSFLKSEGLPFSCVLSEERIEQVLGPDLNADDKFADGEQKSIYTVAITLCTLFVFIREHPRYPRLKLLFP